MLMPVTACALLFAAATTASAASPSPTLATLPVVVAPTAEMATTPPSTEGTAQPAPVLPLSAPPAPRPAPAATWPPGAVEGIEASTGVLPPVAAFAEPARAGATGSSLVPLGLLAAAVATLLIATGLALRRRL